MLSFLPATRLIELDNSGRLLNGGKIQTFALGTTVPKATFSDVFGNAMNTNPIILDSVGSADCYLNGSYTIYLYDSNDVLLGNPIDIVGSLSDFITSGSGSFAENIVYSVNNYDDVRNITNPYAWVFVQGREALADGGQGLFQLDINSTDTDDSGITLDPQTPGRYVRYNMTNIDPRWFGLVYDSASSQAAYLLAAEVASARYALPIYLNDSVYINSNYTTQNNSTWEIADTAKFVSTLSINLTFTTGAKILYCGRRVFGNSVQPIFGLSVVPEIRYSYMDADNVEGRIAKLEASSSNNYFVMFDESISTSVAPQLPSNFDLMYSGSVVTITATSPLSYRTSYDGTSQLFAYDLLSSVGTVSVTGTARPENFGSDNNISFKALASIGAGKLQAGSTYLIEENVLTGSIINFFTDSNVDNARIRLSATSPTEFVNCDILYLDNCLLRLDNTSVNVTALVGRNIVLSADSDNAILADSVSLIDSYIYREPIFNVPTSAVSFNNVQISTSAGHHFYKNNSTFDDVYLRVLDKTPEYTTLLGIDSNDKVITIDNLVLPSISATNVTFENTPITRKLNPTRIDFRWFFNAVAGHTQCEIYRDNVLVSTTDPNPLTGTYTTTSADGSVIIASTSGSTYTAQACRINLTSGTGLASTKEHVSVMQDGSIATFLVGGNVTAQYQFPSLTEQYKYSTDAYYDSRSSKWILG